jgi:hypothetical protein
MNGMSEDQKKAMKKRVPMHGAKDEEEKWKIIYQILFPDTVPDEIPAPCKY